MRPASTPTDRSRQRQHTRRLVPALIVGVLAASAALPVTSAAALPAVPDVSRQYWFGNLRIAATWQLGATGKGITVAVLDSGVQANTTELRGVVLPGTDLAGGNGETDTDTKVGHGTSMARLIAGQGGGRYDLTGIAPDAKILPVTVNNHRTMPYGDADSYSRGIRYAVDHGAKVLNISQTTDGSSEPGHCPAEVADAVRYAIGKDAVVVAAAGNEGSTTNAPSYPAACPGVLAVGAVDGAKRAWDDSQRQSYVDVAAPGVEFLDETLYGEGGTSTGTSNSAALVSASLALIWSKLPKLTNRQVVARALATVADDATTRGRDDVTGYGIVRPYFAITENVPADAPNPVFDEIRSTGGSSAGSTGASAGATSGSLTGSPIPGAGALPASPSDSGTSTGLVVAAVAGAVVLLALIALLVLARRRRPSAATHQGGPPPASYR